MTRQKGTAANQASLARVRRIIAGLGVTMVVIGIVIGIVIGFGGGRLGIDAATARLVSSVLILAGIADLLLAMIWDRLFGTGR